TYNNSYQTLLEYFTDFVSKESVKSIYLRVDDQGCRDLLAKSNQSDKNVTTSCISINAVVKINDYNIIDEITHFKIRY
ncbi:UDP-N-acetylmuramate--L-alanine ligase, partial [Francisella tularensis subsp. holarctica]|nr:UDP-N-acetylmuramate--L-alanine ligase [Francisella tularensis subsp. holarctica]